LQGYLGSPVNGPVPRDDAREIHGLPEDMESGNTLAPGGRCAGEMLAPWLTEPLQDLDDDSEVAKDAFVLAEFVHCSKAVNKFAAVFEVQRRDQLGENGPEAGPVAAIAGGDPDIIQFSNHFFG
jgi:hypothetical protein